MTIGSPAPIMARFGDSFGVADRTRRPTNQTARRLVNVNASHIPDDYPRDEITGVILAGGRATRMGGVDKGLVPLAGQSMIAHVIAALRPQVGGLIINANRNAGKYEALGWRVVADGRADFPGPLAGFLSALQAATTPYVLVVPCDAPMLPGDLAARLFAALAGNRAAVAAAHDGRRLHPVFALLTRDLKESLADYLETGERKAETWLRRQRLAIVDFSDRPEAFLNVNHPEDRDALELRLSK